AAVHVHAGEFAAASGLIEEADAIVAATRNAPVKYSSGLLAAWRAGPETEEYMRWGLESAVSRGEGRGIGATGYFRAVLYNGLGRYEEALGSARAACEHDDLGVVGFALVELVEAAARSGARGEAAAAQRRLEERTSAVA